MIYDTDMPTYEELKLCLSEIYPSVEVKLLSSDPMLKELGFVDKVPCRVEVCATDTQIEEIRFMALDFELAAIDTPYGISFRKDDEVYLNYIRYAWLYDFL